MCYVSWTYFGFYPGSSKYSWHCEPVIRKFISFPFPLGTFAILRLITQTQRILCVSFPLPGGISSPSLSTCWTHSFLSPGMFKTSDCFWYFAFCHKKFCEGRSTAMCRLCMWFTIARFPGSHGGDQSEFLHWMCEETCFFSSQNRLNIQVRTITILMWTDLLEVAKRHLAPS